MSWLKALASVPDGDRSWSSIISWWELRRLVFNAVVAPVGLLNLLAFAHIHGALLAAYLPARERDWDGPSVPRHSIERHRGDPAEVQVHRPVGVAIWG